MYEGSIKPISNLYQGCMMGVCREYQRGSGSSSPPIRVCVLTLFPACAIASATARRQVFLSFNLLAKNLAGILKWS